MKNNSQKKLAIMLGVLGTGLVFLLVICIGVLEGNKSQTVNTWRAYIESGDNALEEGDYVSAEVYYQNAISMMPGRDEEPYVKLVDVYFLTENYDLAYKVIEEGKSCLSVHPELDNQNRLLDYGYVGTEGEGIPSATLAASMEEEQKLDYDNGFYMAFQGDLAAVVTEGIGIDIYSQDERIQSISAPGIIGGIAFNGEDILYVTAVEGGQYALFRNNINYQEEEIIGIWDNLIRPVGKLGEDYYFILQGETGEWDLYYGTPENDDITLIVSDVVKAEECDGSIYYLEEREDDDMVFSLWRICPGSEEEQMLLSEACRYMSVSDGKLYFAESEYYGSMDEWAPTAFYQYEADMDAYNLLGISQSDSVFTSAVTGTCAIYYTEDENKVKTYYRRDFYKDSEAFLLETVDDMKVYTDGENCYILDDRENKLYQIQETAILESKEEFEDNIHLYMIYNGWVYVETEEGQSYTPGCYGAVS